MPQFAKLFEKPTALLCPLPRINGVAYCMGPMCAVYREDSPPTDGLILRDRKGWCGLGQEGEGKERCYCWWAKRIKGAKVASLKEEGE